jgi:ABC-type bacteriocin/lantibiotic exporter with double-glycine peptidase domain
LSHWGREVNLDSLTEEIYIPKLKGTLPIDMERAARARGLEARSYRGSLADLRGHISLGHPVIAFLNLGNRLFPNGHFVVVTGYDDRTEQVFAHSVTEPDTGIAYGRFVEGWTKTDFWTLLVIPKGPAPTP